MDNSFENAVQRDSVPFRNDIVGSFLRPQVLKDARAKHAKGNLLLNELKKIEDEEIIKLIEKQIAVGLNAVTDGEFRRSWWHLDFMWGLDGVEKSDIAKGYQFQGEVTRAETACLSGKIKFGNHPFLEHYGFLKKAAGTDVIARQSIPAPAQFLSELQRPENKDTTMRFYSSMEELVKDIAKAYQDAIQGFYDLGCRSLQFDDCTWGMMCDKNYMKLKLGAGFNLDEMAALYVQLNNAAIEGHASDMTITTHICRGNYHSTWAGSGGYEPIAETLFGAENVDAYYLEFDTDRAGDFSPLRFVSNDKLVVLGLVTSKTGELEDKQTIVNRIREATQYIPINRLCLSPQCGFASTEEGNILTAEQQWDKLRLIKEISNEIWK
ncbi:Methionine synthase II (cobalamin-independent) [Olavius sp. associated proteobacterium Delta 1]|nr:Methionine synthase II (cobalamin-independent) [Olavius sp. associated proteobacterium Delta 1]